MINFYKYCNKELNPINNIEIRDGGLVIGTFNGKEIILSSNEIEKDLKWGDAIEYCNELEYNGYNDWKLPNKDELKFIHQNIHKSFSLTGYHFYDRYFSCYWSTTESEYNHEYAWFQYFKGGSQRTAYKVDTCFARAIRYQ